MATQYIPFLNYNIPDILPLFGQPSLSTFYMVFLPVGEVGSELADAFRRRNLYNKNDSGFRLEERVSLLCSRASIPGSQFDVITQNADRMGVTESFPNFKVFPDISFSFISDGEHKVIRLFDEWMNFISPITGDEEDTNSILRFRYPDSYVLDMYVVKFEKQEGAYKGDKVFGSEDTVIQGDDLNAFYQSKKTVYKFKRAYPYNFESIPLSYEGSNVLEATIGFKYDRFFTFDIRKNTTPSFITEFISNIIDGTR